MKVRVEYQGHAQHFIGGHDCRFHISTLVAKGSKRYVISTVGEYYPGAAKEPQEIGWGRKFETYVFEATENSHECGCPVIDNHSEIDSLPANDAKTATQNHRKLVDKYVDLLGAKPTRHEWRNNRGEGFHLGDRIMLTREIGYPDAKTWILDKHYASSYTRNAAWDYVSPVGEPGSSTLV